MNSNSPLPPSADPLQAPQPRREFLRALALGAALSPWAPSALTAAPASTFSPAPRDYRGPNVILIRFGGGVRRLESIDPQHTYAPCFCHDLIRRGALFPQMAIDSFSQIETSHGQGTLYLLTGRYDKYKDIGGKFLGQRFEPKVPTLFEYLRKSYNIPSHQALLINGEDRKDEEFYNFSNHTLYGVDFRSATLSLHRFKAYLLRRQLSEGGLRDKEVAEKQKELLKLESLDYRTQGKDRQSPEIERFWERWRGHYGEAGLVNPRGDRLLTDLALRALQQLKPRLMMVNYNDPDYVHWGIASHYTRGITVIDEGIKQIVSAVEADPAYRDNTVFAIVPDCGRDTNPFAPVPFQHHFNSKSAREVFALFFGPGIAKGVVVDRHVEHISVASTIGHLMGFKAEHAEGRVLEEAIA
ncbi:MAG: hypothetical protein HYR88_09095 [Verrucomicrobia bacterium]|nr:hypothetical protein [Verrucomicrobiota bacterium]MBI3870904.1 hypothetical protein [Verrucomicrobiota bacterium]